MFILTDAGEEAAQNPNMKQDHESRILTYMFMVGKKPVELEELQDEVKLSDEKTIQVLKRMVNENLISEV